MFNVLCPGKIQMHARTGNVECAERLPTDNKNLFLLLFPLNRIISHSPRHTTGSLFFSNTTAEFFFSICSHSLCVSLCQHSFERCSFHFSHSMSKNVMRRSLKVPVPFLFVRTKSNLHVADEGHKHNIQHLR